MAYLSLSKKDEKKRREGKEEREGLEEGQRGGGRGGKRILVTTNGLHFCQHIVVERLCFCHDHFMLVPSLSSH